MPQLLSKAPLAEVVLELRWSISASKNRVDPHHKLFVGRLYDRLRDRYPDPKELPFGQLPDAVAFGRVQQQFRSANEAWPIVQVGPGVATLNDTARYSWEDFRERSVDLVGKIFDSHPKSETLEFTDISLRYLDAIPFDASKNEFWSFLAENLNVSVTFPEGLFRNLPVEQVSDAVNLTSDFICHEPKGRATLKFRRGKQSGNPVVLLESKIRSVRPDICEMPRGFSDWLNSAHKITHNWFERLIDGPLRSKFE